MRHVAVDAGRHVREPAKAARHDAVQYRLVDGYRGVPLNQGRPINVSTIDLVGGGLKVSFTPQWGGNVWSLTDSESGRDLIFSSPSCARPAHTL